MGKFVKGDVVVLPFPFSDLSGTKRRPAFVLTDLSGDDIILCQITSKSGYDPYAVSVKSTDFISGSLPVDSYVRPNKIFTADKNLVLSVAGRLSDTKINEIGEAIIKLIS
ncbi:MAG: type II toxin-antitoxin system PemK/MazF family toxin [Treponema sp.]|jgi:mRNA interferase MazF|nr:type II toxin-antitoxin system PemK/MazF family toxin [Treponema sp.]